MNQLTSQLNFRLNPTFFHITRIHLWLKHMYLTIMITKLKSLWLYRAKSIISLPNQNHYDSAPIHVLESSFWAIIKAPAFLNHPITISIIFCYKTMFLILIINTKCSSFLTFRVILQLKNGPGKRQCNCCSNTVILVGASLWDGSLSHLHSWRCKWLDL